MQEIIAAVRDAVKVCRTVQEHYLISNTKTSGNSKEPVTIADYGSQAIICRALQKYYPDDAVVSEESGKQFMELIDDDQRANVLEILAEVLGQPVTKEEVVNWLDFGTGKSASRTWVIDPIDGTKEFITGGTDFTVNIGLIRNGVPVLGVIYAPVLGELYSGYGAGTAKRFVEETGTDKEISVRPPPKSGLRVVASKSHGSAQKLDQFLESFKVEKKIKRGSTMKVAAIASGKADIYPRFGPTGQWDTAAADAILRAAGGTITDLDGKALFYGPTEDGKWLNPEFVACSFDWFDVEDDL